jgi:catechol 2,3-dioxygenase-like lactoylglutathione lyase family enzyme
MANYWYDHVHLYSSDPLKTAEFYEKMFDAKRIAVRQQPRVTVEVSINGARVLIAQAQNPLVPSTTAGLDHWGIRTDDIESTVAKLKANGVKFRDEIREPRLGLKIAFFWAPDNVLIEIMEVKPTA